MQRLHIEPKLCTDPAVILQTFLPFLLVSHWAFLSSQSEPIFHCFYVIRKWKGWYTVAGEFGTEVKLSSSTFCSSDLNVYSLSDRWLLHKPSRTSRYAITHSKKSWMLGQFFRHCAGSTVFLSIFSGLYSSSLDAWLWNVKLKSSVALKNTWLSSDAHLCFWDGLVIITSSHDLWSYTWTDQRRHF